MKQESVSREKNRCSVLIPNCNRRPFSKLFKNLGPTPEGTDSQILIRLVVEKEIKYPGPNALPIDSEKLTACLSPALKSELFPPLEKYII